ncbi:hypothetical protein AUJ68_00560 [Candidatus Woesearchaeota archaeon CG1_02_57_44]|nr:MAG: hypothetical protein AUJ68_00560 [Candidatus Woesearchaeota archaeon CG1_02_57_44]
MKKLTKVQADFVTLMSHELRTPLTPMQAQLEMVMGGFYGSLNAKQKRSLRMILRNTVRLNHLIKEIIDLARMDAGNMSYTCVSGDVAKVARQAASLLRPQARQKGLYLRVRAGALPECAFDHERMHQVFLNLLGNALKYTDRGGIEIALERASNVPQGKSIPGMGDDILVRVSDTGIGIAPEHHALIFEPFKQLDAGAHRVHEGSGLGLAIAKGIVQAHGGRIWVESTGPVAADNGVRIISSVDMAPAASTLQATGTTFLFTIPLQSTRRRG